MVNVIEEPKEQQDRRMAWWREAKLGMMVHWGLYSLAAGMWKGECVPGIGEWIQHTLSIPIKEYEQLAAKFNPVRFNAKEWVQLAKEAGMKSILITTKHHDGFCMWDTKLTDYNIVKATPFKRDPLKELAEACQEEGIRLGLYYSQTLDWHHPDGMGNTWDYSPARQNFTKYFREYVEPQLRELLTNYGPIAEIGFDIGTPTPELAVELKQLVRQLQPNIIIGARIDLLADILMGEITGKRTRTVLGDVQGVGDNEIPEQGIEGDWGTGATTNDTYGYKSWDHNWKSAGTMVQLLVAAVSKGASCGFNVGPTAEGIVPEPCVRSLKEVGQWLTVNGESIYGATASPIPLLASASVPSTHIEIHAHPPSVAPYQSTAKGGNYYIHIFAWPWDEKFKVSGVSKEVKRVYLLADPNHDELRFDQDGKDVVISVADKAPDPIDTVVVLEINK